MGRKREITGAVTAQTFLFNAALEFADAGGVGLYSCLLYTSDAADE